MEPGTVIQTNWRKHTIIRMLDEDHALAVVGKGKNPKALDYFVINLTNIERSLSPIYCGCARPLQGYRKGSLEVTIWQNGHRAEVTLKDINRLDERVAETLAELWEASKKWLRP